MDLENKERIEHRQFELKEIKVDRFYDQNVVTDYYHIFTSTMMTKDQIVSVSEFLLNTDNMKAIQIKTCDMAKILEDHLNNKIIVFEIEHTFRIIAAEPQVITHYRVDDGHDVRLFMLASNCYLSPEKRKIIHDALFYIAMEAEKEATRRYYEEESKELRVNYKDELFSYVGRHDGYHVECTELRSKVLNVVKFGTRIFKYVDEDTGEKFGRVDTGRDDGREHILLPNVIANFENNVDGVIYYEPNILDLQ